MLGNFFAWLKYVLGDTLIFLRFYLLQSTNHLYLSSLKYMNKSLLALSVVLTTDTVLDRYYINANKGRK